MEQPKRIKSQKLETRNLRTQPFIIPHEANSVGKAWEEWLEGIEREYRCFRITGAVDKNDAIIIYGGKEIVRLEISLPDPEVSLHSKEEQISCEIFILENGTIHWRNHTCIRGKAATGSKGM